MTKPLIDECFDAHRVKVLKDVLTEAHPRYYAHHVRAATARALGFRSCATLWAALRFSAAQRAVGLGSRALMSCGFDAAAFNTRLRELEPRRAVWTPYAALIADVVLASDHNDLRCRGHLTVLSMGALAASYGLSIPNHGIDLEAVRRTVLSCQDDPDLASVPHMVNFKWRPEMRAFAKYNPVGTPICVYPENITHAYPQAA